MSCPMRGNVLSDPASRIHIPFESYIWSKGHCGGIVAEFSSVPSRIRTDGRIATKEYGYFLS